MFQFLEIYKKLLFLGLEKHGLSKDVQTAVEGLSEGKIKAETKQKLAQLARVLKAKKSVSTGPEGTWIEALKKDVTKAFESGFSLGETLDDSDVNTINDLLELLGLDTSLKIPNLAVITSVTQAPFASGAYAFQIYQGNLWIYRGNRCFGIIKDGKVYHRSDIVQTTGERPLDFASRTGYNYYGIDVNTLHASDLTNVNRIYYFGETISISETSFGANFNTLKKKVAEFDGTPASGSREAVKGKNEKFATDVAYISRLWSRAFTIYSKLPPDKQKEIQAKFPGIDFTKTEYLGKSTDTKNFPSLSQIQENLSFVNVDEKLSQLDRAINFLNADGGIIQELFNLGKNIEEVKAPIREALEKFGIKLGTDMDQSTTIHGIVFKPGISYQDIKSDRTFFVITGVYRGINLNIQVGLFGNNGVSIQPLEVGSVLDEVTYKTYTTITEKSQFDTFITQTKARIDTVFAGEKASLPNEIMALIKSNDFSVANLEKILSVADKFNKRKEFAEFITILLVHRITLAFSKNKYSGSFEETTLGNGIDFNFDGTLYPDKGVITPALGDFFAKIGVQRVRLIDMLNASINKTNGGAVEEIKITPAQIAEMKKFLSDIGLTDDIIQRFEQNISLGIRTVTSDFESKGISNIRALELGEALRKRNNPKNLYDALIDLISKIPAEKDKNEYVRRIVITLDTKQILRNKASFRDTDTKESIIASIERAIGIIEREDATVALEKALVGFGFSLDASTVNTSGGEVRKFPAIGGIIANFGEHTFNRGEHEDILRGLILVSRTNPSIVISIGLDGKIKGRFGEDGSSDVLFDPQDTASVESYLLFYENIKKVNGKQTTELLGLVTKNGFKTAKAINMLLVSLDAIKSNPRKALTDISSFVNDSIAREIFHILGIEFPTEPVPVVGEVAKKVSIEQKQAMKQLLGISTDISLPIDRTYSKEIGEKGRVVFYGGVLEPDGSYSFQVKTGESEEVTRFSLSPDGKKIDMLFSNPDVGEEEMILTVDASFEIIFVLHKIEENGLYQLSEEKRGNIINILENYGSLEKDILEAISGIMEELKSDTTLTRESETVKEYVKDFTDEELQERILNIFFDEEEDHQLLEQIENWLISLKIDGTQLRDLRIIFQALDEGEQLMLKDILDGLSDGIVIGDLVAKIQSIVSEGGNVVKQKVKIYELVKTLLLYASEEADQLDAQKMQGILQAIEDIFSEVSGKTKTEILVAIKVAMFESDSPEKFVEKINQELRDMEGLNQDKVEQFISEIIEILYKDEKDQITDWIDSIFTEEDDEPYKDRLKSIFNGIDEGEREKVKEMIDHQLDGVIKEGSELDKKDLLKLLIDYLEGVDVTIENIVSTLILWTISEDNARYDGNEEEIRDTVEGGGITNDIKLSIALLIYKVSKVRDGEDIVQLRKDTEEILNHNLNDGDTQKLLKLIFGETQPEPEKDADRLESIISKLTGLLKLIISEDTIDDFIGEIARVLKMQDAQIQFFKFLTQFIKDNSISSTNKISWSSFSATYKQQFNVDIDPRIEEILVRWRLSILRVTITRPRIIEAAPEETKTIQEWVNSFYTPQGKRKNDAAAYAEAKKNAESQGVDFDALVRLRDRDKAGAKTKTLKKSEVTTLH